MRRTVLPLLLWLTLPGLAFAQALVFVHGYQASGQSWREAGIVEILEASGWHDAGHYTVRHGRISLTEHSRSEQGDPLYTVDLPDEARIAVQARLLRAYLQRILKAHPDQQLALVGHSAGGVVARWVMVHDPDLPAAALITIASPHLGTNRAEIGLMAGDSPLGMMAPMVGLDTLNRSRGLFTDLVPPRPGTLLFWLNRQPHPEARYVAIVRKEEGIGLGDFLVPAESQDLRRVPALAGQAHTIEVPNGHGLGKRDGRAIARVLKAGSTGDDGR